MNTNPSSSAVTFAVMYPTGKAGDDVLYDTVSTFTDLGVAMTFYDTNHGVKLEKVERTVLRVSSLKEAE